MICWYCYWGWAKPVADIYDEALRRLDGDDHALTCGPSHIVWADENFGDHSVDFCLSDFDDFTARFNERELAVVRWSLEELRKIPESIRECEPVDYDGDHPDNYPPTGEMVKR